MVDDCFADFDRAFAHRTAPHDPVAALRWAFDRYVEYGLQHPTHYRLMFGTRPSRPSPAGLASYDGLRRRVLAIADAGRLVAPLEDATAAFWAAVHGVTSLLISEFLVPRIARDRARARRHDRSTHHTEPVAVSAHERNVP